MSFRPFVVPLLALALAGCASPGVAPPPGARQAAMASGPYVIGIPDLLRITVWKHPDLSVEAPVRSDGKISVPLLDDVQAAGLTPEDLKQAITERLSAFISQPDVTVIVLSPDSQVVTVVGGVAQSGPVSLRRRMGVLEAVAAAGGFSAWANKGDIRVIRTVDGQRVVYAFDYKAYMKGEPGSELLLLPGDVVVVPE
jgi:polysaccharide export outer membrane protein